MNAIEFVKKFGLGKAKGVVAVMSDGVINYDGESVNYSELKQIVEAFELVEIGLHELKKSMFSNSKDLDYVKNWLLTVSEKLLTEKGIKLKQAVYLIEKCK